MGLLADLGCADGEERGGGAVTFNPDVRGPDVSFYQDPPTTPARIDFAKMKAAGATFVILRAGQNVWEDPAFAFNYKAAKEAGLPRGIYFFYDSRATPEGQAALCLSLASGDPPELGFWLDLEENYNGPYKGWQNWKKCLTAFRTKTQNIGVYTAPFYWMTHRPTGESDLYFFASFPLWIAHYNVSTPIIPSPWGVAVFWQVGTPSVGLEYGVESLEIDMNYFNGTPEAFRAYFGLSGETAPQEGQTMATYQGTVLATVELAIREGPGTTYNKLAGLHYGDKVEASNIVEGWWHLTKVNNAIIDGYSFSNNGAWIKTDAVLSEPPAPAELPSRVGLTFDGTTIKWYVAE